MTRVVSRRVAYHDACHLAHGQGVRSQPRQILSQVPACNSLTSATRRSAAAAPASTISSSPTWLNASSKLKVDTVLETGAELLATGNPGCLMQIAKGLKDRGSNVRVVHPIEIVGEAYGENLD